MYIKKDRWPKSWLPINLILLAATGLYFYQISTESLAWDEFFSIRDAQTLNPEALRIRPVYYLLLHGWMQLGTSDAWLRSLSVIFALGSIILIYWLGCRLVNRTTGLVSAVLFTLSPYCIYNAQEVRMYMVSVFFGLGGTLLLTYALEKPTHSRLAFWSSWRLLAMLTYPLNFLLLLPDLCIISLQFRHQRSTWLKFVLWLVIITLLWLPFAYALKIAEPVFMSGWVDIVQKPSLKDAVFFVKKFTIRWWQLETPATFLAKLGKLYTWMYTLMLFGLLGVALGSKRCSNTIWWAFIWFILPLGSIFLISQGSKSLWVDRYLLFTAPYLMIVLAAGFNQIWQSKRQRLVAIIVAMVYFVAVIGGVKYYYTVEERTNWRDAIATIQAAEKTGDRISVYAGIDAVNYYYQGEAPIYEIPPEALTVQEELDHSTVEQALEDLLPIESRLWFIYRHRASEERHAIVREVVKEKFKVLDHQQFTRIDLFLLKS